MPERLGWIRVLYLRTSVCRYHAEKVIPFVQHHHLIGCLNELKRKECRGREPNDSCGQAACRGFVYSLPGHEFCILFRSPRLKRDRLALLARAGDGGKNSRKVRLAICGTRDGS